jgi:hypothetical protein
MECEYLSYFEPIVYTAATECLLVGGFIAAAARLWCCQLLQTTVEAVG